ncbi:hypothetical protein SPF06_15220 [Sinomonas sp. JGH33]|uniref:Integron gene cassette protein n=1 Tax=Sinomonas terricola TaxID=3110330 RepID=A0ABU5T8T4_9MICC|nr:hypothetical protein [Sinomonas sp. JGH33]MEA5456084.1 hypothetical protein [Sinomonas sp. JGH33]
MMNPRLLALYIVACSAGAFLAALGLFSYYIRYSHLDSLEREIPDAVYLQVTSMFDVERVVLLGGAGLFVVGAALAIVAGITTSARPR